MMSSSSRENILKKIKQALVQTVPVPFPESTGSQQVFSPATAEPEILFAENFIRLSGRFSFCLDEKELAAQLHTLAAQRKWKSVYCCEENILQTLIKAGFTELQQTDIKNCDASITGCEHLVARTGSILMSSAQESGRTVSVYAPVHICIAYTDQLVHDIGDGLERIYHEYGTALPSMITLATGPSRTADIEKTLVVGVHGPKEVFCFLLDR